jgi:hypothetical protein
LLVPFFLQAEKRAKELGKKRAIIPLERHVIQEFFATDGGMPDNRQVGMVNPL